MALQKMATAGKKLATIFETIAQQIKAGVSTLTLDQWIAKKLKEAGLVSRSLGYLGYRHVSCLSVNDEVVHGIPRANKILKDGDLITVDVCASWQGYCADMARSFFVGGRSSAQAEQLVKTAQEALDAGIAMAQAGNRLSDISAAIQGVVEAQGFGVVRDFAGHGIGKNLHEEPELLNYGKPGKGPVLQAGMTLAIEPMITQRGYQVYIEDDGWTVKTEDGSLAAHVEDTVAITPEGVRVLTRL